MTPDTSPPTADGDPRSMRERMLAGDLYRGPDPELEAAMSEAAVRARRFNDSDPRDPVVRREALVDLLGSVGEGTEVRPPLHCDYGSHVTIGARCFVNFGLTALDVAPISIGDDVLIGPNVQLLTPTHPVDPGPRREKWEAARPITIGDNVWIGGSVVVCPGVSIGDDSVVGAGSVVTKDVPAGVVVVGNPARVVRRVHAG